MKSTQITKLHRRTLKLVKITIITKAYELPSVGVAAWQPAPKKCHQTEIVPSEGVLDEEEDEEDACKDRR